MYAMYESASGKSEAERADVSSIPSAEKSPNDGAGALSGSTGTVSDENPDDRIQVIRRTIVISLLNMP